MCGAGQRGWLMNENSVFVGSYTSDGSPEGPVVAVFRPLISRPASILRMSGVVVAAIGVVLGGFVLEAFGETLGMVGLLVLLSLCAAFPVRYFRNSLLFATDEHFGVTSLTGKMTLVSRDRLARVEAGDGFKFKAADDSTLLFVKAALWEVSQVRRLSHFLNVPFEVEVRGRGDYFGPNSMASAPYA